MTTGDGKRNGRRGDGTFAYSTCRARTAETTTLWQPFLKADSTYRQLKELVLNYRFRPGEPLSPISIADRLQVSATPVREALARLHGEDLVGSVPNRGFFAKTLNAKSMRDHYEFAFQIAVYAIERGYSQFGTGKIALPEETRVSRNDLIKNKIEQSVESQVKLIERLYIYISALADSQVMVDSIRKFNNQTRFVRLIDLEMESNFQEITADMSDLVGTLERQDVTAAVANLRRQRDRKLARMNELVTEGISRSLRQVYSE
ncbi:MULTISPECIES: GntR family transcriptional regulator [unclassified Mesorhizobium]|uniref:GntR family transcriptional regulator n=1 Tax=unclassified Mesorhizobium TaxID=325217 RepID=UPI000FE9D852|nr:MULTISPECIES: GntR family transcriptional regulator [unclassified Mesorhizobium]RWB93841.1 MAG: GntR family transcriptional regulator [Mesorhizobium sp.]TGV18148.1 GntR family transcriptional regulator [Mesorhizobium sp. M4B.F.Ca.ET.143.01.1.1]TIU23108.1 MAG: GntR family transcriptional regulator [Mesorhizobium sp.]